MLQITELPQPYAKIELGSVEHRELISVSIGVLVLVGVLLCFAGHCARAHKVVFLVPQSMGREQITLGSRPRGATK